MQTPIGLIHHLAGAVTALSVIFTASGIFTSATSETDRAHGLSSDYFRLVSSEDYVGLLKVAAAKAIDSREVALAYPTEVACRIASDASLPEATTVSIVATAPLADSTSIKKGDTETLAAICNAENQEEFFLTTSSDIRREAELLGLNHPYIAIAVK